EAGEVGTGGGRRGRGGDVRGRSPLRRCPQPRRPPGHLGALVGHRRRRARRRRGARRGGRRMGRRALLSPGAEGSAADRPAAQCRGGGRLVARPPRLRPAGVEPHLPAPRLRDGAGADPRRRVGGLRLLGPRASRPVALDPTYRRSHPRPAGSRSRRSL
ncbi:MAG: hypothetical protein AVDCRST_MAG76-2001, partial [uncultured Acidimicrobiales bacterium]